MSRGHYKLFRKTNSFKQLHVALEENSNISIVFCHDLEDRSRYVRRYYNDCLPDPHTTTTTEEPYTTYPTTPTVTPSTRSTTEAPTTPTYPNNDPTVIHSFISFNPLINLVKQAEFFLLQMNFVCPSADGDYPLNGVAGNCSHNYWSCYNWVACLEVTI